MSDSDENKDDDQKKIGIKEKIWKRTLLNPRDVRHRATEDAALGDYEGAIEGYDEFLQVYGDDAEVLAMKARAFFLMGEEEEANDTYELALKKNPKKSWIWLEKGFVLEEMERWSEAVLCYQRALEHRKEGFLNEMKNRPDPIKEGILGPLSHAYFHAGSKDDLRLAEKYAKEALEIEPKQHEALLTKAHLLIKHEKWEQVLDVCKIILNDDEEDEDFLEFEAIAHLELKDTIGAYDSISRLLVIDDSDGDVWYYLACYYVLVGKHQEAIDKLTVAIHLKLELNDKMADEPLFDEIKSMPEFERLLKLEIYEP